VSFVKTVSLFVLTWLFRHHSKNLTVDEQIDGVGALLNFLGEFLDLGEGREIQVDELHVLIAGLCLDGFNGLLPVFSSPVAYFVQKSSKTVVNSKETERVDVCVSTDLHACCSLLPTMT